MEKEPMTEPLVDPAPRLPQGTILNYVANISTATRVRVVASRALIVMAILQSIVVALMVLMIALELRAQAAALVVPWQFLVKETLPNITPGLLVLAFVLAV